MSLIFRLGVSILKTCVLNVSNISNFIAARNIPYSFVTICSKELADFYLDEEHDLCIRIQHYDENTYNEIISQSKNWEIKIIRTEDWDPSIYNIGKTIKEGIIDIDTKIILVKNGNFAGIIDYADCGEHYELSYVLLGDYVGEPILLKTTSGFGSSDHDMMYTVNFYLQKKN